MRLERIDLQEIALHGRIADQITSLPFSAHSVSSRSAYPGPKLENSRQTELKDLENEIKRPKEG